MSPNEFVYQLDFLLLKLFLHFYETLLVVFFLSLEAFDLVKLVQNALIVPVGVLALVGKILHDFTESRLVLFFQLFHDIADGQACRVQVSFHPLNLILEEPDLFLKFAAISFQLFLFLLVCNDFSFVFFILILEIVNFSLKCIKLLQISLVLFALKKRLAHDIVEFTLQPVSVCPRLVDFFLDQNVCFC